MRQLKNSEFLTILDHTSLPELVLWNGENWSSCLEHCFKCQNGEDLNNELISMSARDIEGHPVLMRRVKQRMKNGKYRYGVEATELHQVEKEDNADF